MSNDNPICSIDDCKKLAVNKRGWCSMHYARWRTHGDPLIKKPTSVPNPKHLEWLNAIPDTDDCLNWPFSKDAYGYGRLSYNGRLWKAHRLSLVLATADSPDLLACHLCLSRLCCNPRHLYWGTHKDNSRDRVRDRTDNRGVRHYLCKLTPNDVKEIRTRSNESTASLAKLYGVSSGAIKSIRNGRSWAWLE